MCGALQTSLELYRASEYDRHMEIRPVRITGFLLCLLAIVFLQPVGACCLIETSACHTAAESTSCCSQETPAMPWCQQDETPDCDCCLSPSEKSLIPAQLSHPDSVPVSGSPSIILRNSQVLQQAGNANPPTYRGDTYLVCCVLLI